MVVTAIDRNILPVVLFTSLLRVPAYVHSYFGDSLGQCEEFFLSINKYIFIKEISNLNVIIPKARDEMGFQLWFRTKRIEYALIALFPLFIASALK